MDMPEGLKIRRGQPHGGSIPPPGTKILRDLYVKWPLQSERPFPLVAVLVAVGFSDRRGAVAETGLFAVNSYGRFSLQRLPLPSQRFLCNLTAVGHTGSSHMGKKSGKPTDVSERKSSHVPGQYLGYALQPTRLLSLALDAAPGSSLSLEVFEDVGVEESSGERLASQTKTAIGRLRWSGPCAMLRAMWSSAPRAR
jgi:hypothetical protein